jgi:GntR family transcriptional repressor for pyruvate dehydrogenase complex
MVDPLRPVARPRLYEQLVSRLLEHIAAAGLVPGDRLPSERELAARLGVSRNSLKQAFVVLEIQGLVEIRQGDGTYLRSNELAVLEPIEVLLDRRQRLPVILEAREAIEVKVAELAAVRRTAADLRAMEEALATMRADIEAGRSGAEGDRLFHAAVVAAGRNPILASFYDALGAQVAETREESLKQAGRPQSSMQQHARILHAVQAQDPGAAVAAVVDHVRTVRDTRLLHWEPTSVG